jgi:DNA-binding LytR/AlgR family response regulator
MRILIIEDEPPAAKRLKQMLQRVKPDCEVQGPIDTVQEAVQFLRNNPAPDLALLDIQLADGLSFEILSEIGVELPVIFTTAYDQYTLKAFKHNSVDYLLKPIDEDELEQALQKYERLRQQAPPTLSPSVLQSLRDSLMQPQYKNRFIIKLGQQLSYISTDDICYFYAEEGIVYAQMPSKKRHAIDYTLDALEPQLDPQHFFRLNRKVIANIRSVQSVAPYFNGRLILKLSPPPQFEVTVSRDRANDFKNWLGG